MKSQKEKQNIWQSQCLKETEAHVIEAKAWLNSEERKQFDKDYEEFLKRKNQNEEQQP
jgi:hypothetical protein